MDSFLVFSFRWEIEREFLIVRRIMQEEKAWDGVAHGGRLAGEGELGQRGDVSGRGGGMGPRMREDTGRERRGWLWGAIDSSLRFATFRMTCGVRCAQDDMWGGVRTGGSRTAPTRGGCGGGGGDGSPHARGHGRGEAGLVVGSDRFFTSLRYVQNDMWGALRSG